MTQEVLRQTAFARFWSAETVSGLGSHVTTIALQVLVVVTLHGTASDVGLLNGARWLPYLVLGLVVGALVDRRPRKPVLVATDLGRGLLLGAVPLLWLAAYKLGHLLLGSPPSEIPPLDHPALSGEGLFERLDEIKALFWPTAVGGVPLGALAGIAIYLPLVRMVGAYQTARRRRRERRQAARRAKVGLAGSSASPDGIEPAAIWSPIERELITSWLICSRTSRA